MDTKAEALTPAWVRELQQQIEQLSARVAALERSQATVAAPATAPAQAAPQPEAAAPAPAKPKVTEVTEEDMIFISAAVAAYLGVHARIRQVRLVQSSAWAQVGRASIHASHRVH